jgi:hypothetical protein
MKSMAAFAAAVAVVFSIFVVEIKGGVSLIVKGTERFILLPGAFYNSRQVFLVKC